MNYRKFGGMDWQVSEIGLGTWQLGADWGNVDDAIAEKVLRTAVESGVTGEIFQIVSRKGNHRNQTGQVPATWRLRQFFPATISPTY